MRIGFGYDIHRLVTGRQLIVGGVVIPSSRGEDAHSDGDVLIHAIIDALLGAVGLGDIGRLYPPSDPAFESISSRTLLRDTGSRLERQQQRVIHLDSTVILESPQLASYIGPIKGNLAEDLKIAAAHISVKAKTKEGLGSTGHRRAIEAYAVALVDKIE